MIHPLAFVLYALAESYSHPANEKIFKKRRLVYEYEQLKSSGLEKLHEKKENLNSHYHNQKDKIGQNISEKREKMMELNAKLKDKVQKIKEIPSTMPASPVSSL